MTARIDWGMAAGYAAVGYVGGRYALRGQRYAGLKGMAAALVLAQLAPRIPVLQARLRPVLLLEDHGASAVDGLGAFWNRDKDPDKQGWLSLKREQVSATWKAYRAGAPDRRADRLDRRHDRMYDREQRRETRRKEGTGGWTAVNKRSGWSSGQRVRSSADAVRALTSIFSAAAMTHAANRVASRSGWRRKNAGGVLTWGLAQAGTNTRVRAQIVNLRNEWEHWHARNKGARQRRTAGVLNQLASFLTGATHAYADQQAGQYRDTGISTDQASEDPGAPAGDEGTPAWVKPVAIGAGVLLLMGGLVVVLRR